MQRRTILQGGSGLILAALTTALPASVAKGGIMEDTINTSYTPPGKGIVTGKGVGDFDFLTGTWKISHLRLKDGSKDEWQRFDSSATVHRVLNGMGSVEELRKADGSDLGMGVRVWLPQEKKWADHWTSAANGVVNPPQKGEFIDGEGVFISEETVDGVKWQYRGVWDQIGDGTCRWHQSASSDGGKSWEWNWWMEWTRV
jgi:hypothetical protein